MIKRRVFTMFTIALLLGLGAAWMAFQRIRRGEISTDEPPAEFDLTPLAPPAADLDESATVTDDEIKGEAETAEEPADAAEPDSARF